MGCDTNTCLYNKGKGKLFNINRQKLKDIANKFYKSPAKTAEIVEQLINDLYRKKMIKNT